jgi:uncharacterized OB-fold protein
MAERAPSLIGAIPPVPDADSQPFWEACQRHELRIQQCTVCSLHRWPPRGLCPRCHAWTFEWALVPGKGSVASFVVPHHGSPEPFAIAAVDLHHVVGHVRMTANLVGIPWEEVRVGMPVRISWLDLEGGMTLPQFVPDLEAEGGTRALA